MYACVSIIHACMNMHACVYVSDAYMYVFIIVRYELTSGSGSITFSKRIGRTLYMQSTFKRAFSCGLCVYVSKITYGRIIRVVMRDLCIVKIVCVYRCMPNVQYMAYSIYVHMAY